MSVQDDAKSFAAIVPYLPNALAELQKHEERKAIEKSAVARDASEAERRAEDAEQLAAARLRWDALHDDEREAVRQRVRQTQPKSLEEKRPDLFERFCVREFAGQTPTRYSLNAEQ